MGVEWKEKGVRGTLGKRLMIKRKRAHSGLRTAKAEVIRKQEMEQV